MKDLTSLFLYIPGIVIFLAGSGQVRKWLRIRQKGGSSVGTVLSCSHVVKKDKKERDVYNFYDVLVEYLDEKTGHRVRQNMKSPTEYAVGQEVRVFLHTDGGKPVLDEKEDESLFNPWAFMIGGALLILLALFENQGHEVRAMACLTAVLIGAGAGMIWNYVSLKRRNLQELDAEITDVYSRQISRESKLLRGSKYTYYPVVRYILGGKENLRRCNINSSSRNSFQTGEHMTLYYDPGKQAVMEKHANVGVLAAGIVILVIGLLAGGSILSVIM